ncbi:uncharacterized protein LY89DRAFT_727285 [Mollisia scopiformis]|uniref:Uncharacterized protein n=1 Tax=Mollisia scopiformis TaxID=149040 RepID=A0A194XV92_MOLSC|nr:uncharacterized protein LY89DRAFT_727285 [Mollisia scopiformis]KUJ24250.1 hypothetical protein LY89DRAFT_727285 [Mollisia scopiformis]
MSSTEGGPQGLESQDEERAVVKDKSIRGPKKGKAVSQQQFSTKGHKVPRTNKYAHLRKPSEDSPTDEGSPADEVSPAEEGPPAM